MRNKKEDFGLDLHIVGISSCLTLILTADVLTTPTMRTRGNSSSFAILRKVVSRSFSEIILVLDFNFGLVTESFSLTLLY